ncbi:hypothetical protein F5Y16DRAFT_405576 [Xylariaceae sp. FL0255]|nr:hypothetical protein F5Y16DRAFT_405576 [Xylariaceae sp. FL0255]
MATNLHITRKRACPQTHLSTAGICRSLAEAFLSRPYHIVIERVGDETSTGAQELKAFKPANVSRLILVGIDGIDVADLEIAIKLAQGAGIEHINIVVSVVRGAAGLSPLAKVTREEVIRAVNLNVDWDLYVSIRRLNRSSKNHQRPSGENYQRRRFHWQHGEGWSSCRLCTWHWQSWSQLGAMAAHCGKKELIALSTPGRFASLVLTTANDIHSIVQTDGGNQAVRGTGMRQAPHTKKQSNNGILKLIDNATRADTSGKF